jgi:hypothetical protein
VTDGQFLSDTLSVSHPSSSVRCGYLYRMWYYKRVEHEPPNPILTPEKN